MFNGWKNYETWNVALWIKNDELLHMIAKSAKDYEQFRDAINCMSVNSSNSSMWALTPDGVFWNDPELDITELNEVIKEIK